MPVTQVWGALRRGARGIAQRAYQTGQSLAAATAAVRAAFPDLHHTRAAQIARMGAAAAEELAERIARESRRLIDRVAGRRNPNLIAGHRYIVTAVWTDSVTGERREFRGVVDSDAPMTGALLNEEVQRRVMRMIRDSRERDHGISPTMEQMGSPNEGSMSISLRYYQYRD